ncbi:hypothetical protein BCR35DRAFT_349243, partial [Leucosporidium creatinivorum]
MRKATSQQPLRKDSLRANRSQMEADFTTTFPAHYTPTSSAPPIATTPSTTRATSPRTLSAQASFIRPTPSSSSAPPPPTSVSALPTTTDSPLQRQPSTSTSTCSSQPSAPPTRNNSTSASAPIAAAPPLPRSRQPSTTSAAAPPSSLSPTTSSRPLPTTSTSSRRQQDPHLPSARVSPAPPTAMYWSRTPVAGRVPRGMRAHSATVVGNEVWCFGGCDIRGGCFKDVWKLDCDTFVWSKPKVTGEIPPVTRAHTATLVDRRLFIFGGGDGPHYYNDTYIFDTLSHTWTKPTILGVPPSRRRAHTSVLYGHLLLIFGGGNGANALNDVHSLDVSNLEKLEWKEVKTRGRKPIARGYHSMNLVGSKAVVFGGSDGTECFSDVFVLDLETLLWTEVKPDLTPDLYGLGTGIESFPRLSHTCTTVGSYLFIVGGHDGVSFSSDILLFNLVTLQWEPRPTSGLPPSPRGYHATILHDSRILIFGGFNGQAVFDEVWTLDLGGSAFLPQITNFRICETEEEGEEEGEEGR